MLHYHVWPRSPPRRRATHSARSQGELLRAHPGLLDGVFSLGDQGSGAAKLLQFARSVPGVAGVLVGHKLREHVEANSAVARTLRLGDEVFGLVRAQVAGALKRAAMEAAAVADRDPEE